MNGFFRGLSAVLGLGIIAAWVLLIGALGGMSCGYVSGATCGLDLGALFEDELIGGTVLAFLLGLVFLALAIFGGRKGKPDAVD